jgi:hypothetical protein
MMKLDLSQPFKKLITEAQRENKKLRLEETLSKINAPLEGYAASFGLTVETLSLLHISADNGAIHPHLERHISSLEHTDAYKGQHISRIKNLIEALLNPETEDAKDTSEQLSIERHLPEPLRPVWSLLPRRRHPLPNCHNDREDYHRLRLTIPLSSNGICLAWALIKVCRQHNGCDVKAILEEYSDEVITTIRGYSHPSKWKCLIGVFDNFRWSVREYLAYEVAVSTPVTLTVSQLPEPLRTQLLVYKERARFGFKTDLDIKINARTKYKLDLSPQSEETISLYEKALYLGVGHIPRDMYGVTLDIRDLLKLTAREVEVDEVMETELYNPLVEYYRRLEQAKDSDRKGAGFDSTTFGTFVHALAAIGAFNGRLHLRKQFLKEYKPVLDTESKERHKRLKKRTFGRLWLGEQIQRLRTRFKSIATDGTFKNEMGGTLRRANRYNLNLCLFYVALVTLRYLGVRQQCIRDCLVGKNVIFGAQMTVTFQWTDKQMKNGKGLRHELNMKQHFEVQEILIEAAHIYYSKIYPYLCGATGTDQSLALRAVRQQEVAGQFFLKCGTSGICMPFTDGIDFHQWFTNKTLKYIEFGDRLAEQPLWLNPHFLRAMFGDWLRFDLRFSGEQTAQIAGDTEETFETEYITHPTIYDATEAWTEKSEEIRAKRKKKKAAGDKGKKGK